MESFEPNYTLVTTDQKGLTTTLSGPDVEEAFEWIEKITREQFKRGNSKVSFTVHKNKEN